MGTVADSAKSAKNLARQAAKQMAREPLEILKSASEQIAGRYKGEPPQEKPKPPEISPEEKAKIDIQGQRQLSALEAEIRDIQKKKEEEAAAKAQEEEALKAQAQAVTKELPAVPTKRSRRLFGFGQKAQAEKQKTRVEKPLPPSG